MFVVAGAPCGDADTRYAMRTLAHQVALALGSAELSEEVHRQAWEARFSTLVANATDLITVLRADNTIAYQSPSIERVLGYTADEVIGRSFESLLHPEEQGRMLRRLVRRRRRHRPSRGHRVPAADQGRRAALLRDPPLQPARRRGRPRHRPQRPRRL